MTDDLFNEFLEFDFTMGIDIVKCHHCGVNVPCSIFFDEELECTGCGKTIRKKLLNQKQENSQIRKGKR